MLGWGGGWAGRGGDQAGQRQPETFNPETPNLYSSKCGIAESQSINVDKIGNHLAYVMQLPGRKSGFRAGFRPDSSRESLKLGPPAGLWVGGWPI